VVSASAKIRIRGGIMGLLSLGEPKTYQQIGQAADKKLSLYLQQKITKRFSPRLKNKTGPICEVL